MIRGRTRAEIEALVDSLSPAELAALADALPLADAESADARRLDPAAFAAELDDTFRLREHTRLVGQRIRATVDRAAAGDRPAMLAVSMPPRTGKSELASVWTPAWAIEADPTRRVIVASAEATLATSFGRRVRDLLAEHAARLRARVSPTVNAASEWETTAGGGMVSRGIGGMLTGRGADLLIIDDPIRDHEAAASADLRDRQWDWLRSVALPRLEPGGALLYVMTRWHQDDLIGRILSGDHEITTADVDVVRIPAVGEPLRDGDTLADEAPDALAREPGVPLILPQADHSTDDAAERWASIRRQQGPTYWAGLYQQRPSAPEGAVLRRDWLRRYHRDGDRLDLDGREVPLDSLTVLQSWDLAFSDTEGGSYVVGQVWGAVGADAVLLDQYRDRADYPTTREAMRDLRDRWPQTTAVIVERKANGAAILADLRSEIPGLVGVDPRGSKVQRAYAVQGQLEGGQVWVPHRSSAPFDVDAYVAELGEFPRGAHDDQVDATTQALLRLRSPGGGFEVPRGSTYGEGTRRLATTRRRIRR